MAHRSFPSLSQPPDPLLLSESPLNTSTQSPPLLQTFFNLDSSLLRPDKHFHNGCYCFRDAEADAARQAGLPVRCGAGLPCACTNSAIPLPPDPLPPFDDDGSWEALLNPTLPDTQPPQPLNSATTAAAAAAAAAASSSVGKRPRASSSCGACSCPCTALHAATAAAAAVAATTKLRRCCGPSCSCPPGKCRCPQTAVPSAPPVVTPDQFSQFGSLSEVIAKSVTTALQLTHPQYNPQQEQQQEQKVGSCCKPKSTVTTSQPIHPHPLKERAEDDDALSHPNCHASSAPTELNASPLDVLSSTLSHCSKGGENSQMSRSPGVYAETQAKASEKLVSSNDASKSKPKGQRVRSFACNQCNATFFFKQNRDRHVNEVHLGKRPHKCIYPSCNSAFKNLSGLKQHVKTVHEKARPFKCELCDSAFGQRNHLRQHILVVHDKIKMYRCSVCSMSFSNVGNRTQHTKRRHPHVLVNKGARVKEQRDT